MLFPLLLSSFSSIPCLDGGKRLVAAGVRLEYPANDRMMISLLGGLGIVLLVCYVLRT